MLEIENLILEVDGRPVLKGLDLRIEKGECHVLLGPNGSGKTSLLLGILGFPRYRVTGGRIGCSGKPDQIIRQISEGGYEKCIRECQMS